MNLKPWPSAILNVTGWI